MFMVLLLTHTKEMRLSLRNDVKMRQRMLFTIIVFALTILCAIYYSQPTSHHTILSLSSTAATPLYHWRKLKISVLCANIIVHSYGLLNVYSFNHFSAAYVAHQANIRLFTLNPKRMYSLDLKSVNNVQRIHNWCAYVYVFGAIF